MRKWECATAACYDLVCSGPAVCQLGFQCGGKKRQVHSHGETQPKIGNSQWLRVSWFGDFLEARPGCIVGAQALWLNCPALLHVWGGDSGTPGLGTPISFLRESGSLCCHGDV